MDIHMTKCCANVEIHGLSDKATPEEALVAFLKPLLPKGSKHGEFNGKLPAHVIFTQAENRNGAPVARAGRVGTAPRRGNDLYGDRFANYLEENELGAVVQTEGSKSPRTGHSIVTYIWTPDPAAMKRWAKENHASFCTCGNALAGIVE